MLRAAVVAAMLSAIAAPAASQERGALRVTAMLVDAQGIARPVSRHALLVSENPPTAAPRRIVTATDGTATITLPPGNYTVESDRPVIFQGKPYEWRQYVDIASGRDATLALTAGNALAPDDADAAADAPGAFSSSFLLNRWQDSVVTLWTPAARVSGFVVDERGLVVTSRRAIGDAQVQVQITPQIKVAARVLAADAARDVAVLWIDRTAVAGVAALPLACEAAARPVFTTGQELVTIGAPMAGPKDLTFGDVTTVSPASIAADLRIDSTEAGGPVFGANGSVIGITSSPDETNTRRDDTPVVRLDSVCEVVAAATAKLPGAPPPDARRLPVEPARPYPLDELRSLVGRRAGSLHPYELSASDFDVAFITPVHTYGAQQVTVPAPPVRSFGAWSRYVATFPPVLLVRVSPKAQEGFWTRVGRFAVSTQGVALPPITRITSGLSRLRAFCGATEVTPIHPLTIAQRISATEAVAEGLYVFDPSALGPHCGTVRLELYSQKTPARADTRTVDPVVVQQIWGDFAPFRSAVP